MLPLRSHLQEAVACLAIGWALGSPLAARADIDQLQKDFQTPPADARIMVRWWWFGPAVTKEGIEHELKVMKAAGIGGVEVQPTYPLAVDGGAGDAQVKNLKFMSPEFLDMLTFTAGKCKELGLRMDLTLGSGWPFGGPEFSLDQSAGAITASSQQVQAGQSSVRPNLRPGQSLIAAFIGPRGAAAAVPGPGGRGGAGGGRGARGGELAAAEPAATGEAGATEAGAGGDAGAAAAVGGGGPPGGRGGTARGPGGRGPSTIDLSALTEVPIENGAAQLPEKFTGDVIFFIASHANGNPVMQVKRPALGAEGNVMDHLSGKVVDKFIAEIAEKEIQACVAGGNAPYAIFCDSLEVGGENWTPDFLAEFQKRRGYDLRPFLPALVANIGEKTEGIRYDYGRTLTDLFNDNFNAKFTALAHKYGSRFRIQGYGSPPAGLLSYGFADLPEGEAGGNGLWRNFRATRYASSASHLLNQKVTSSETFTWLHQAPFRATPLDIKGEADTHFLDGINQIICHGWPYTGNGASYPGWSFYAGGVFDDKNPWFIAMPDITLYMQRMSAMLRQGTAANDIAVYLPDADVWSRAWTGYSSMNAAYTGLNPLVSEIVDWGYNLDAFDDGMLAMKGKVDSTGGGTGKPTLSFGDQKYKVVILPGVERMSLDTARALEEFADAGGILLATGTLPQKVPGFKATADEQKQLQSFMQRLFTETANGGPKGIILPAVNSDQFDAQFGKVLTNKLAPDVAIDPVITSIGAIHRHTDSGEVYFFANTGNQRQSFKATFRIDPAGGLSPEWWNPLSGQVSRLLTDGAPNTVTLQLEPLSSGLIVWTKRATALPVSGLLQASPSSIDLSENWSLTFAGADKPVEMQKLVSWTTLPERQNFSGVASYEKRFALNGNQIRATWTLNLGPTAPVATAPAGRGGQGYSAPITPPVLDAAVIYVNGQRVGAVWCPPYAIDLTGLKEGENTIRIDVGNTAINTLAKTGFPNYDNTAVRAAFGNRFDPQGRGLYAQPLPSGLTGPIKLEPR